MTTTPSLFSALHWEHSPRRHGLWTEDGMTRIAYISLSLPHKMGGPAQTMYSWSIDWPHYEAARGEATSLSDAKKQVAKKLEQHVKERE